MVHTTWRSRMRTQIASLALLAALSIAATSAASAAPTPNLPTCVSAPQTAKDSDIYLVSAVLRKSSDDVVIRLVHAVQRAPSNADAEKAFLTQVTKDFQGYAVLTTLVTPPDKGDSVQCTPSVNLMWA